MTVALHEERGAATEPVLRKSSEDLTWIDQARGAAALAVVILHVSAGVVRGVPDISSFAWWVGNIVDSAVRWCVPVFVMISGALMLDLENPTDSLSRFYVRRVARLGWPLLFWSTFFLAMSGARDYVRSGHVKPSPLAGGLLSGHPHYHLWYLYMLLGLYLFAPFVRVLLQHLDPIKTLGLCLAVFFLAFASTLHDHVAGTGKGLFLLWFLPYLAYFIAGGIVRNWRPSIDRRRLMLVVMTSVLLTATGCHALAVWMNLPSGLYFYDYFSVTVIPMAVAVFLLLRDAPVTRTLVGLAPLSLGVYLVHPLFLDGLSQLGFAEWRFNPVWAIPAKVLLVLLLSLSAVWMIRRIPILRRVV